MASFMLSLVYKILFRSDSRTASANGTGVDVTGLVEPGLSNYLAFLDVGTVSGTTPTLDVKLQDSPDNSVWTDIAGATFTQVTATGANQQKGFVSSQKFVRAVATIAGTSPNFNFSCYFIGQKRLA